MTTEERLAAIYSRLPKLACQRLCQESCGPIAIFPLEWDRMAERVPHRFIPVRAIALRVESDQPLGMGVMPETGGPDGATCQLLLNGACSTYSVRPLLCRLWGLTKTMRCPFGCEPERWLSDREGFDLMDQILALQEEVANGKGTL